MENILEILSSEIVFWTAWVIIPLIMEIIPAMFGAGILIRKRLSHKSDPELSYFPQLTLIVPVYNSAVTLRACLDSIKNSTYPLDQILVMLVNNESKDNSFDVFTQYQQENTGMNLKWMNARQGKSKALNMALFNSEGKYIVHIDSDGVLQQDALSNLVKRFEAHEDIHCMTGTVLTNPDRIKEEKRSKKRLLQTAEFYEYCQAFLAGRNYEAELNSIFTMSGAFSCFRKSTILKTQMYNTETLCEDTHVTFQIRYLLKKKIGICENALFFVDPIDSAENLYLQRQRWQRGEIEVIHMFPVEKNLVKGFFTNFMSRIMVYDHTFAFPRMIWYFALICLTFLNYPFRYLVISATFIYVMYTISAFLYYLNVCTYLKWNKELRHFYRSRILYVFVLPLFNIMVYWFRLAGIINSIKGSRSWRAKSFSEEVAACKTILKKDASFMLVRIEKLKKMIHNKG